MAHLLHDADLFNLEQLNPFEIYELTIGDDIFGNNFPSIKWASSNTSMDYFSIMLSAARIGSIECLKYFYDNSIWNSMICDKAAKYGQLDCLKYLYEEGCQQTEWACQYAAENGHLSCLKYLHEHGCPWDESTCEMTAEFGHLDILKYAHEHGCPWDEETCVLAVWNGHFECLRYAHEQGCLWNEKDCVVAAMIGPAGYLNHDYKGEHWYRELIDHSAARSYYIEHLIYNHRNILDEIPSKEIVQSSARSYYIKELIHRDLYGLDEIYKSSIDINQKRCLEYILDESDVEL